MKRVRLNRGLRHYRVFRVRAQHAQTTGRRRAFAVAGAGRCSRGRSTCSVAARSGINDRQDDLGAGNFHFCRHSFRCASPDGSSARATVTPVARALPRGGGRRLPLALSPTPCRRGSSALTAVPPTQSATPAPCHQPLCLRQAVAVAASGAPRRTPVAGAVCDALPAREPRSGAIDGARR